MTRPYTTRVYFYLPVFRRSGCSGSITTATATVTAIVTLHYVIVLRVYFCLPALGERTLLYETFIQWHDPTQHGYTFIYPHYGLVQYREFCWWSSWVSGIFFSARKMDVAVLWWSILYPSSCRNTFAHVGMRIVGSAYCAYSLCGYSFAYPLWMWLVIKVDVIHLIAAILLSTHILVETDIVSADSILSR